MIQTMFYDGSTSILDFYSRFLLLTGAVNPAIPHARRCNMYASRFPAGEYMALLISIDATTGHTNFDNYARAVNNAIQMYHQRVQVQDRRSGTHGNTLFTDIDEHEISAYLTDAVPLSMPCDETDGSLDISSLSLDVARIVEAHLIAKQGNRQRPSKSGMHASSASKFGNRAPSSVSKFGNAPSSASKMGSQ